jgi:2-polyprenyl-3-methyl-5-hydroxy-6-metoxy-1,4-benzoquinol methylase
LTLPLRAAAAALLRPQQPFNSVVVQLLNHLHHANAVAADRQDVLHAMLDDAFGRIEALAAHVDFIVDERMDEIRRYSEALAARERRLLDAVTALRDDHAEIRTAVNVLGHETRYLSKAVAGAGAAGAGAPAPAAQPTVAAGSADALAHKYVGFEDEFRGSQESIREGVAAYVPLFAGASDVLDVGCGRGEFLLLLRERGIRARGIDLNESMVDVCRARGLEATVADALSYVRAQPDGSLGGLFAAQVVEHLPPVYLTQLLDAAFEKLRPGAAIVLETINPACWFAFFSSYIRDITHERALHPETLKFLLVASGFQQVTIRYSAPYPDHDKLQTVTGPGLPADAAETLNANVEKINRLLFTYLDYAAIGRRP